MISLETHYSECWHFVKGEWKKKEIKIFPMREALWAQGQALQLVQRGKELIQFLRGQNVVTKDFWVRTLKWGRIWFYRDETFFFQLKLWSSEHCYLPRNVISLRKQEAHQSLALKWQTKLENSTTKYFGFGFFQRTVQWPV